MPSLESKLSLQQNEIEKLQKKVNSLQNTLKKQQAKAQKKINELKNYYESMLAILPGHVYWIDRNNRYLGCNDLAAKNAGLPSRNAIVGKRNQDLFQKMIGKKNKEIFKEQATYLDNINNQIMETGIPLILEEVGRDLAGDHIYLSHKAPLFNMSGEVVGLIGVSIDMTEQKMTEKRLAEALELAEAANNAKNSFIANMSHDIRTPLSGIIGMSSLLEKRHLDKESQQYASWIYESGNQLLHLLNHILELVSSDNLKEHSQQEEMFSLKTLITDILSLEQPSAHLKNIEFRANIDPNFPELIYADRFKLHRILLNLLGNAVKFTQQGYIELDVKIEKETETDLSVVFHVRDTGIGIPLLAQPHVFDRFFRANPSDKGLYPGSGVGLHIVKTYINLLGGTISLTSEDTIGTTFTFNLTFKKHSSRPIVSPPEIITPPPVDPPPPPAAPSSLYFLLVEDNLIALKLLEQLISKLGYRYQSATTAEEGWNLLLTHSFDIIITDIGLPGLSGIELTKLIREQPRFDHIKIAGLTAHTTKEITHTCLKIGMNSVIIKPITLPGLEQTIAQLNFKPLELQIPPPLGKDLPESEQALFQIDFFPLLDIHHAVEILGEKSILKDMLAMMLNEQIPHDLPLLKEAYEEKDWKKIEALAHKMKAGALYCGTVRLQMACQYLERYYKAGHEAQLEALYQQLMRTLTETIEVIREAL